MRAVDTNVLVCLVVRDDASQAAAAESFVAAGAWASHVVLVELAWVLHAVYERSAREIAGAIEKLLDHRELTLQDPDVVAAALETFRRRPSVGFSDCLLLAIARKARHLPLGTFDRDLGRLDGAQRL